MSNKLKNKKGGISILGVLLIGVVLIFVLSHFNINIQNEVESPTAQNNVHYVQGAGQSFWNKYLKGTADYLWYDVWINIFWKSFINSMEHLRDGGTIDFNVPPPTIDGNSPQ